MSGSKRRVSKSSFGRSKYASKYVRELLEKLITSRLASSVHPVSAQKWLKKMQSSIQRKVMEGSKVLFAKEAITRAQLEADIQALTAQVQGQQHNLQQLLRDAGHNTSGILATRPPSSTAPYAQGQFEATAGRIQQQFKQVALQVDALSKEVSEPRRAMEGTLETAKQQVQPVLMELQARRTRAAAQGKAGSSSGAGRGAQGSAKKGATTPAAPAAVLQKHLGKK